MAKTIEELLGNVVSGLGLPLTPRQLEQLATHFALLLRWNQKINLTSLRRPEEIAMRHFEESLFLVKLSESRGSAAVLGGIAATPTSPSTLSTGLLVDVGSGAGFPGLPIKIACPSLTAVLLEPNKKKAAFLKEVVRSCNLEGVEVRTERLEELVAAAGAGETSGEARGVLQKPSEPLPFRAARVSKRTAFSGPAPSRVEGLRSGQQFPDQLLPGALVGKASLVTLRAVKPQPVLLKNLAKLLAPRGQLALFLGINDAAALATTPDFQWADPVPIPHSERRVVLLGQPT